MPYVDLKDIRLYYESHGPDQTIPLIMFEGWGTSLWMWFRQLPTLSKERKIIIFDNRGVGKSSKPDVPYTIPMFAKDTKDLLDTLGIGEVYIFGISMGGYIAQQYAFTYPEMVKAVILSSTGFGGTKSRAIQPNDEIMAKMFAIPTEALTAKQATAIRRSTAWSTQFLNENVELVKQMDKWMVENPTPEYARGRQAEATFEFNSEPYLSKITAPTCIMHGEKDLVVPTENARMLHEKIQNSSLYLFRNSPHRIEVERHQDFNKIILDFLKSVDNGIFTPQAEINYV